MRLKEVGGDTTGRRNRSGEHRHAGANADALGCCIWRWTCGRVRLPRQASRSWMAADTVLPWRVASSTYFDEEKELDHRFRACRGERWCGERQDVQRRGDRSWVLTVASRWGRQLCKRPWRADPFAPPIPSQW